jgi:hypothetical protein
MLTKGLEVMKYIKASAGRAGLNVVWERTNQPRHDGDTIYLPEITIKTSLEELKQLMASTDHEVGHDRFSDFTLLKEKNIDASTSLLGLIWNLVEDSRVNVIEANNYQGFKENWNECTSIIVGQIVKNLNPKTESFPVLLRTLFKWESSVSSKTFPMVALCAEALLEEKSIMEKLMLFSEELLACQTVLGKREGSDRTYLLAKEILRALGGDPEKEEEKAASRKGKPSEEKGEEDGEGVTSEEEGEASTDAEKAELGEDGKPLDSKEWKIITVELDRDMIEKTFSAPHDGKRSRIGTNVVFKGSSKYEWTTTPEDQFIVVNYPKNEGKAQFLKPSHRTECFKQDFLERTAGLTTQEGFVQSVRRLIQIRAKVQREYGVKKGKLDSARISRICFEAPGLNEKIFKRKIVNTTC